MAAVLSPQELQPGDILVERGSGFPAWLVRMLTGSPYTHVALAVGGRQIAEIGATFPARVVPFRPSDWTVLRYPGLGLEQKARLARWCRSQVGQRYDWAAIWELGVRLWGNVHACLESRRRYICTELVLEAYEAAGIYLAPGCDILTPAEVAALPGLYLVDRGVA